MPLPVIATTLANESKSSLSRTSDTFGANIGNMDASLALIRRKIQERCTTTQELNTCIRRIKLSEGKFMTPNEFRHMLIKFGILLNQEILEKVFTYFDVCKTNSIDFDIFSRWMFSDNAKAAPGVEKVRESGASNAKKNADNEFRNKLCKALVLIPTLFGEGKTTVVDYNILSSSMGALPAESKLTDKDIRYLFSILDIHHTGEIDSNRIIKYANTGIITATNAPASLSRYDEIPSLAICIQRICGIDATLLEKVFSKIPKNTPLKLTFPEFLQYLSSEGMGSNKRDAENLYIALGGDDTHAADIALLLNTVAKIKLEQKLQLDRKVDPKNNLDFPLSKAQRRALAAFNKENGITAPSTSTLNRSATVNEIPRCSEFPPTTPHTTQIIDTNTSRAARRLREAIRKCYKVVKDELKLEDKDNTGFIEAEKLLKVINTCCYAISMDDFRYILQPIRTDSQFRVNWQHFLYVYNPSKAPHMLETVKPIAETAEEWLPAATTVAKAGSRKGNRSPPKSPIHVEKKMADLDSQFRDKMKKCWQKLLKECQSIDVSRNGAIEKNDFLYALSSSGLEKVFGDAKDKLLNNFTSANGNVDYVNCIRKFLLELSDNSLGQSMSASTFRPRPEHHAREIKAKHPWEFDYKRAQGGAVHSSHPAHKGHDHQEVEDLYWQQACTKPRQDVTAILNHPARGKRINAFDIIRQNYTADDVHRYFKRIEDSKTLYAIRRMYAEIGSDSRWSQLQREFKKVAEAPKSNSIPGSIDVSVKNFHKVVHEASLQVTKSHVYSVAHAFRGQGMPEVVRVDEMYAAMKLLKEDDMRRGYSLENDELHALSEL